MGRKYIKRDDAVKVNAYLALTDSSITIMEGYWQLSTPKEVWYYETTADLMDDIRRGLRKLKKQNKLAGTLEAYESAMNNDGRIRI